MLVTSIINSVTRILISSGSDPISTNLVNPSQNKSVKSGILTLRHMCTEDSMQATYELVQNHGIPAYGRFAANCNGRIICGEKNSRVGHTAGGLFDVPSAVAHREGLERTKNVYQFENNRFTQIKPLNWKIFDPSAVYFPPNIVNDVGVLIILSGWGDENRELSKQMEYLIMDDSFSCNDWRMCLDCVPVKLDSHQTNNFQKKLILTGGEISGAGMEWEEWLKTYKEWDKKSESNAWEGSISFEPELRVKWNPLPPMRVQRCDHIAVVIGDKLFCIGGQKTKSTEYYSFATNSWQQGPELPFTIYGATGVVNALLGQCFIVGGCIVVDDRGGIHSSKVYLFDPQKGLIDVKGEFDIGGMNNIAVLL